MFDWAKLRNIHKSFLDSIIVELCLPQSLIPKSILFQILEEAFEESSRDTKLFPQGLWDAIGDLGVSVSFAISVIETGSERFLTMNSCAGFPTQVIVKLQELLESPLLGADRTDWLKLPRKMPEAFEHWVDAQILSEKASRDYTRFKDIIHPLSQASDDHVLKNMWKIINFVSQCTEFDRFHYLTYFTRQELSSRCWDDRRRAMAAHRGLGSGSTMACTLLLRFLY